MFPIKNYCYMNMVTVLKFVHIILHTYHETHSGIANSISLSQTAPKGAVCTGPALVAYLFLSKPEADVQTCNTFTEHNLVFEITVLWNHNCRAPDKEVFFGIIQ